MAEKVHKVGVIRKTGYLYFIDEQGDISRTVMARGSKKDNKPEKVVRIGLEKEEGYLYFIDKKGDISRAEMSETADDKYYTDDENEESEEEHNENGGVDENEEIEKELEYSRKKKNQLAECKTPIDVADYLLAIEKQSNAEVLIYTIKAQLQTLQIINGYKLSASVVDLFFQNLHRALKLCGNEEEKAGLRARMAIMLNSMVFFMQAKIIFLEDKASEDGRDLLKQGCVMLAEAVAETAADAEREKVSKSIVENMRDGVVDMATGGEAYAAKLAMQLFKNLTKTKNLPFFKRLIDRKGKLEEIEKQQYEFELFLENTFHKISRYRNLLGKSIIMAELVRRHTDKLSMRDEGYAVNTSGSDTFTGLGCFTIAGLVPLGLIVLMLIPINALFNWKWGIAQMELITKNLRVILLVVVAIIFLAYGVQFLINATRKFRMNWRIRKKMKFYSNLAEWFDEDGL